jgi:hypothetical protein
MATMLSPQIREVLKQRQKKKKKKKKGLRVVPCADCRSNIALLSHSSHAQ